MRDTGNPVRRLDGYTLESFSKDWDHGLEHGPLSVPHLAVDFLPLDLALNAVQLAQHELERIVEHGS